MSCIASPGRTRSRYSRAATARSCCRRPGRSFMTPCTPRPGTSSSRRTPVNEGVWALPFSLERLEATGTAYLVEAGLGTPSVSTTGTFLYLPAATTVPTRLQWLARDGTRLEAIGEAAQFETFPELSPDGTQVAISERVSGTWGLSVIDLARGTRLRLAAGERVSTPAWAPDGRSILYSSTPPEPPTRSSGACGSTARPPRTSSLGCGLSRATGCGTSSIASGTTTSICWSAGSTAPRRSGRSSAARSPMWGPAVAQWPARGVHVDAVDHRGESRGRVEALPGH